MRSAATQVELAGSAAGQAAIHVEHAAQHPRRAMRSRRRRFRSDWIKPVFEAGDHTEVAAAAAEAPEQVAVLFSVARTTRPPAVTTSIDTTVIGGPAKASCEIAEAAA